MVVHIRNPHGYGSKKASELSLTCPQCETNDLITDGDHTFCRHCDWNTVNAEMPTNVDWLLEAAMKINWDQPVLVAEAARRAVKRSMPALGPRQFMAHQQPNQKGGMWHGDAAARPWVSEAVGGN